MYLLTLALKSLPDNAPAYLSWAVMLHDIGKPETIVKEGGRIIFHNHAQKSAELAQKILERLKFSTTEKKVIIYLVENHMKIAHIEKMRPSKRMAFLTDYRMDDLIKLTKADQRGKIPTELDFAKELEKMSKEAKKQKKKIYKKKNEKIFSGDDLIKMGIEAGPIYSEILQEVEDRIISGEIVDRNDAVKFINKNYDFK